MRLRRLDLTRYGKFTERTIDFGPRTPGEPDLHIIYGPNEAGKSTAFSAFLDLLFGIEMQSRYGFLHSYDAMQVGGCLELSVGARELVRIKKPQPTLRDSAFAPVAETLIQGDLAGLDRQAYRTMFSLDDESLEAGGKSILASNGELGRLLFSASAGLSELSRTLAELRAETEGFTKPARSSELHTLKASLIALKQQRDEIDTIASDYNRLAAARDAANIAYDEVQKEVGATQASLNMRHRMLAALPRAVALRRLRTELEPLSSTPVAPPGWLAELPELLRGDEHHRSAKALANAEVERLAGALSTIVVDTQILALAGRLDRLMELRARHVTADLDLPLRRAERARADGELDALLRHLSREGDMQPQRLLLNAAQSAALQALIASRSGILARVDAAAEELSLALDELTHAQRALKERTTAESGTQPGALALVLATLRASDHTIRYRTAARAERQYRETLTGLLAELAPWQGDAQALAELKVPDASRIEAWLKAAQNDEAALPQLLEAAERLDAEAAQREAERDANHHAMSGPQDAATLRAAREAAWGHHRLTLDARTADSFEAALRRDDLAAEARAGGEREAARLHELNQALARIRTQATQARQKLDEAKARAATRTTDIAHAATAIAPAPSPAWLAGWVARREHALSVGTSLSQAERDKTEAEADADALHRRLAAALEHAGVACAPDAKLDDLTIAAQLGVEREAETQALRLKLADCRREVAKRELAVQKAATADKAWLTAWREACASLWLAQDGPPVLDIIRAKLAALGDLARILAARADLASRIEAMEHDQAAFATELTRLDPRAEPQVAPLDQAQSLTERVQDACRTEQDRRRLHTEHAQATERLGTITRAAAAHTDRVSEMMAVLDASSLHHLAGLLQEADRKASLERQMQEAERDILTALHVADLTEAHAMLDGQEEHTLEAEQKKQAAHLEELNQRARELFAAARRAADHIAAVGGDDAAARIEERRRTKLLETEEKAQRYLRLRVGIAAAEWGLRAYRDHHRSSMMTQASEAFSLISRGAYQGLRAQPDKDGDILVALTADGASKFATDLSKGTRFQLYLALRAAGYREFANLRPPVPFIADDIMETFDDLRTAETLRLFEGMSRLGQVIYLTHHDHVRALAERTVPGVRIHALAG